MGLFDIYPIINLRRNHGLEHATIHILSRKVPNLSMVGRSDLKGFTLYGNVTIEDVNAAVTEALTRLKNGQASLAVHPNCGTILATTGLLTGLASFMAIGLSGAPRRRFRWASIPEAILAATFAALVSQPLGMFVQEHFTVSGIPGNLQIQNILRVPNQHLTVHRITTTQ